MDLIPLDIIDPWLFWAVGSKESGSSLPTKASISPTPRESFHFSGSGDAVVTFFSLSKGPEPQRVFPGVTLEKPISELV